MQTATANGHNSAMDTAPRFITTSDGVRLRTQIFDADAATASRGVCVLLHGQTEFIEKYVEVIGELRTRGFTVATFDWRGQGASARALANPLKAHVGNFAQYDRDLTSFLEHIVAPMTSAPPTALAHSMGAHILLRNLHDQPGQFGAAVLSAPLIAPMTRGYPRWFARILAFAMNAGGNSAGWVLGMDKRDPLQMNFDRQLVTSDRRRFQRTQDFIAAHSDIRLAGPSWGWLEAAYRSMARLRRPGYAEAIATPLLVIGAGHDRIVDAQATRNFTARLPHARYVEFADAEHEILMESDPIRQAFWNAFDAFIG